MEWKIDKNGKRYRKVGNVIEYETEVTTTCGVVPMGRLNEVVKTEKRTPKHEKLILCPLRDLLKCRPDCVFRSGERCTFGKHGEKPGEICPFTGRGCTSDCGFYDNGCRF